MQNPQSKKSELVSKTYSLKKQIELEQFSVDLRYSRFDFLTKEVEAKIKQIRLEDFNFNDQALGEKDSLLTLVEQQLESYKIAENRLVFGALQYSNKKYYIGRIGLRDENFENLLIDWRAKLGSDFYQATPLDSRKIVSRRHITLKNRQVIGLEDELMDPKSVNSKSNDLVGEAAIMQTMNENRTDKMTDIVATIQKEQDEIIRQPLNSILIVQGGAGSGKTAVALHRVAYILYEYREQMNNKNVLIIGPNSRFLNYIDGVLPSLGETGTVQKTKDNFIEFVSPNVASKSEDVIKLKGDLRMSELIRRGVESYRLPLKRSIPISVYSFELAITPKMVKAAKRLTSKSQVTKYEKARRLFVKNLIELIKQQIIEKEFNGEPPAYFQGFEQVILRDTEIQTIINKLYLPLEPIRFVQNLFSNEPRLRLCAKGLLTEEEIKLLLKPRNHNEIEPEDLPLVDEAEFLIGSFEELRRAEQKKMYQKKQELIEFAEQTLADVAASANSFVSAEQLAQFVSFDEFENYDFERYRHIVVDEAQELSLMQFRALKRRSRNNSFTIVGDVCQTSNPAGIKNWNELTRVFESTNSNPSLTKRLTINYRNPKVISDLAFEVAKSAGLNIDNAKAVRNFENAIEYFQVKENEILKKANSLIDGFADDEKSIIITVDELAELKGLEFDNVVLVEPASFKKPEDLYVAMTRATKRLYIIYSKELPNGFII